MEYSPLPDATKSWALVTGAATGLGWKLARACASAGYGLILTDQPASLQGLEAERYGTLGLPADRILTMPMDLADPSQDVALLHRQIREQGLDVCILFVCSDQYSYTGKFLDQKVDSLDKMLAQNVGATTVLCRLFGEDMLNAGRGRILLIGAPAASSLGVAGASAFAGSMAFIRTLSNGLRKEFADTGVGISCMETSSLGRDGSLTEALESTCVGFLVKDDAKETPKPGFLVKDDGKETPKPPRSAPVNQAPRSEISKSGRRDAQAPWGSKETGLYVTSSIHLISVAELLLGSKAWTFSFLEDMWEEIHVVDPCLEWICAWSFNDECSQWQAMIDQSWSDEYLRRDRKFII
eukprot:Skav200008  [mRNA]  locus=scaffold4475:93649:94704:+ [translate_table: standard]